MDLGDPLAGRISSQGEVGIFSWDWEAEPWKTDEQTQGQFQQETANEGDGTRERETK